MKNNVGWLFENLKNHQFSNLKIFKNQKIDFNSLKIIRIKTTSFGNFHERIWQIQFFV